jgi:DNA-binding NarL/FixJ family response regulator
VCPARILIADDHEVVRHGLRSLIREHPEWELVAEVTNGKDAVAKASELKPDIAILDISMPHLSGLDATKQMLKLNPRPKIVILTMHDSEQAMQHALNAGARGYVLKADAGSDMVRAVRALLNGQTFFTQKAARLILEEFTGNRAKSPKTQPKFSTEREREILRLLSEGKIIKEIAFLLNLSPKAVQRQRANLMRKFDCHSVSELVRYAVRNNLLEV